MQNYNESLKKRLRCENVSFRANDNISQHITENDINLIRENVHTAMLGVLDALVIDYQNDHNTQETAKRVAKMYVDEIFKGRYYPMPKVTDFPNAKNLDELYTIGPITIRSACSHHFVPIFGKAWIGVIPSDRVIGISKFNRITDWIMSRPQIQEESAVQLADIIEELIKPKALAVIINASHMCMTLRGVREKDCNMATSVMRGLFKDDSDARAEFLNIIKGQGYR